MCALLHPGVTVVVDPINSLMKDQFDKLLENGIDKSNYINSFNTKDEREKNLEELTESKYLILFVSPERFQMEKFRLSLESCAYNRVYYSYAVIDEAHCVSEWGHDFRHTYLKLAQNLKRFCLPKSGLLSLFGLTATASFDVLADVQRELGVSDEAIVSLPAEAIDRKELNFEILRINCKVPDNLPFWEREEHLGHAKYPEVARIIESLSARMEKLEKRYDYFRTNPNFFRRVGEEYLNAGLIFCPTKSHKLRNGVLALHDFLVKDENLSIGTFFGGGDENTILDERIQSEAALSYQHQEEYIRNRTNLMIATKAFGMGIDKPNIRFSIHYSFPSSVESFYQEAGRAGRDGNPSICTIVYHPADTEANLDFYRNAFKGIEREREIIDELLQEVQYEDNFYLGVLKRQLQDKFPEVHYVTLWKDRYIYINGPWRSSMDERISIGVIDLERNLKSYEDSTKNFDSDKAQEILEYARRILKQEVADGLYLSWLSTRSTEGIKALIDSKKQAEYRLRIGFSNDTVTKICELLKNVGNKHIEPVVIRAAYNFSYSEYDFLGNLEYQYAKFTGFTDSLRVPPGTLELVRNSYNKIRNSSDTQRAIYRMTILGIVDDYVIDYVGQFIEVRFKAKSDDQYLENFRTYLKRYLGVQTSQAWIDRAQQKEEVSVLQKVLYTLIEFIESEVADKRKRSILYMKSLCELGAEQGDKAFRENIIYYFTSKYARTDYLPKDIDGGRIESTSVVETYLNYVSHPPDGLGGEIDNAKHLRGACANLRISMTKENATLDLLTSFSLFALEAKESDTYDTALKRPLITQAIEMYQNGYKRFLSSETESWKDVKDLLAVFNAKILDLNPVIKPLLAPLTHEILINRTAHRLSKFLDNVLEWKTQ
ncbi:DEAD/DEAH box helicase [Arcticibacter sp. MXS-1]|uniref:DEAD/DEAH box helicase n=1 Tax=Arcticibacter sp. MXS-1 TaxID=3341726 RepID=UPI0035A82A8C